MTISEELHKGEKIIKSSHPSPLSFLGWYLLGVLFLFVGFIGIFIILIIELIRRGHTYYITDERVVHEYTLLSKNISSAFYDKIQDIHLTQTLFERILGIGNVYINTAGTFVQIKFRGVENPVGFKKLIEENSMKYNKKKK